MTRSGVRAEDIIRLMPELGPWVRDELGRYRTEDGLSLLAAASRHIAGSVTVTPVFNQHPDVTGEMIGLSFEEAMRVHRATEYKYGREPALTELMEEASKKVPASEIRETLETL